MKTRPRNPVDFAAQIAGGTSVRGRQHDCGHFDIRIGHDGTWYYHGSPITRKPLIKLFSTVLKLDAAGRYWLETPAEKGRIDVDDAPFTAVEVAIDDRGEMQVLTFRTNVDDVVTADAAHPIRIEADPATRGPRPYLHVRDGLDALIVRSVFYELAEIAVPQAAAPAAAVNGPGAAPETLGVWSGGEFFPLDRPV